MKIIYYTTGKSEIIVIKDDDKIIKKGLYSMEYEVYSTPPERGKDYNDCLIRI